VAAALVIVGAQAGMSAPVATAGGTSQSDRAQLRQARVYVQGDSLTVGAAGPLRRSLGRKVGELGVDAAIGRHTETGLYRLRHDPRARRADIWVVALGTNDAPAPDVVGQQVRRSLQMAGPRRAVVWLTLRRPGPYGRVNTMLRRMPEQHPRLMVVDWARTTQRRPRLLAGDGVHATPHGYHVRAALIEAAALRLAGDLP
jgi:lysophospholipase L1-like esterase